MAGLLKIRLSILIDHSTESVYCFLRGTDTWQPHVSILRDVAGLLGPPTLNRLLNDDTASASPGDS